MSSASQGGSYTSIYVETDVDGRSVQVFGLSINYHDPHDHCLVCNFCWLAMCIFVVVLCVLLYYCCTMCVLLFVL